METGNNFCFACNNNDNPIYTTTKGQETTEVCWTTLPEVVTTFRPILLLFFFFSGKTDNIPQILKKETNRVAAALWKLYTRRTTSFAQSKF